MCEAAAHQVIMDYCRKSSIGDSIYIHDNYEDILEMIMEWNEWDGWLVPTLEEIESNRKKKWF